MSYTNGNEYIIKSMNGIKTFDDGSGTVIENGEINTSIMTTDEINCSSSLSAPSVITDFIQSDTNLTINSTASTLFDLTVLTKPSSENSTKVASTAFANTAVNNLLSAVNTWTGTQTMTGANVLVYKQANGDSSNFAATTSFVGTAISNLRSANNTWT